MLDLPGILARLALLELAPRDQQVWERRDLLGQLDSQGLASQVPQETLVQQVRLAAQDLLVYPEEPAPSVQRVQPGSQALAEQLVRLATPARRA